MSKWASDAKQRRSKKYIDLHAQLRREAKDSRRPSLSSKSRKQIQNFVRSELHRLYGDTL